MKIVLNSSEIELAVINYVSSQGVDVDDKDITVDFVNGRGANGNSATVEILPAGMGASENTVHMSEPEPKEEMSTDFDEPEDDDPLM